MGGVSSVNLHEGVKDVALASLPMTAHPTSKPAKRDLSAVQFVGPNASYMASLARLFDAAQTVGEYIAHTPSLLPPQSNSQDS